MLEPLHLLPSRAPSLLALLLLAGAGCGPGAPSARSERPNLLLFSVDTLRADHLGCYGYARETSPNIDRFAAGAVRFAHVFAPDSWTLASHVAMLTGRHPYRIGVRMKDSAIPADVAVVAEPLQRAGYETAAFVDSTRSGFVGAKRGFARGFTRYAHAPHREGLPFAYDAHATVAAALDWLRARPDPGRPFFLFLHTKSVHTVREGTPRADERVPPYDVPGPGRFRFVAEEARGLTWSSPSRGEGGRYLSSLNRSFQKGELDPEKFPRDRLAALEALYDGAIHYVDETFGHLLEGLEAAGLADSTVVVFTADHGEEFLDHGRFEHTQITSELLAVPLLVRVPWLRGGRVVESDVALLDLPPTLLDLAGLPLLDGLDGRPLPLEGPLPEGERPLFAASYRKPGNEVRWRDYVVRQGEWTLFHREYANGRPPVVELYRTSVDPGQLEPVAGEARRRAELLEAIGRWRAGADRTGTSIPLDADTLEQLRALGYGEDRQ